MLEVTPRIVKKVEVGWIIRGGRSFKYGRKPSDVNRPYVTVGYRGKYDPLLPWDQIRDASSDSRPKALFLVTDIFENGSVALAVRLDPSVDYTPAAATVLFAFKSCRNPAAADFAIDSVEHCGIGRVFDTIQTGDIVRSARFGERQVSLLDQKQARRITAKDCFVVTDATLRGGTPSVTSVTVVKLIRKNRVYREGKESFNFLLGGSGSDKLRLVSLAGQATPRGEGKFQVEPLDLSQV